MMSLTRITVTYLLFASTLYSSCICGQLPRQLPSCSIVKETLGTLGNVLDSFTPGNDLQCKLNQTCCSSELEDKLMESNKYKQKALFLSLLKDSVNDCFEGGAFESSVTKVIYSEEAKLVQVISSTFEEHFAPHKTIFHDFFTFLAEIPRTLDMCALKEQVHKVLFKVYKTTIAIASNVTQLNHQPDTYQTCLYNFFLTEKSRDIHQFYKIFEKNFARLWYFMRSRKVLVDVMNEMLKYLQLSDSCNTALLHATDCAKCSGHLNIQVCNNFCVNLFRGCLVDFKEVGNAFGTLHSALKSLEYQMINIFNPDRAFNSFHSQFLTFITATASASTPINDQQPILITKIISKCGQMQQVAEPSPNNVGKREAETDITLVQLAQAQMKCFDKLNDLFDKIEYKMCEANNATSNNNTDCWNGKEFGSYHDQLLDATRNQQQQNSEVTVPYRSSVVIIQLQQILEVAARDIRYLLSQEICVSDDEDNECVDPDDYCNIPIIPQVEVDYSGSGEPPTIDFDGGYRIVIESTSTTVSPTTSSTATSSSQVVPLETNTPSKPTGATIPPEWTADTTTEDPDSEEIDNDGGASTVHQSLFMLLLTTAAVVFLW